MLVAIISPGDIVNEAYPCAYVKNIYPRLDLVLCLGLIAFVCLSVT